MTTDNQDQSVEALMKLAERLRMAPLSGGEYRSAHADLQTAITAALAAERNHALTQAIRLLNANLYCLAKDCIGELMALRNKEIK